MGKKPIAVLSITNNTQLVIYDMFYGIIDRVQFQWQVLGGKNGKISQANIRIDNKNNKFYFISKKTKFYLDEFIKLDI